MSKQTAIVIDRKPLCERASRDLKRRARLLGDAGRELLAILCTARTARETAEKHVIDNYIRPLPGILEDHYGNLYTTVLLEHGVMPEIAFSCHTDSVHWRDGMQAIALNDHGLITLRPDSKGSCLGADCGTGIWIMRQMILAGVPGLYIFHREEETGCLGSQWIVKNAPDLVKGIKAMVAFDRRGRDSVVTHQCSERTCSDEFATALATALDGAGLAGLHADPTGVYTDSLTYAGLISECTNVSVGYEAAHSARESQSLPYAMNLVKALVALDWQAVLGKVTRDHTFIKPAIDDRWEDEEYDVLGNYADPMACAAYDYPRIVAKVMREHGIDIVDLQDAIYEETGDIV